MRCLNDGIVAGKRLEPRAAAAPLPSLPVDWKSRWMERWEEGGEGGGTIN